MIDGMIDLLAIFADVQSISLQRNEVYELPTIMRAAWGLKDMFSSRLGGFLDTKIVIVQQPMGVSPLGIFLIWISVHSIAVISQHLKQMILAFATNGSMHCCRAKWLHDGTCACFVLLLSRTDPRPR